uniref:Uncharacterized protein n=1 Tax=Anopheles christyi TaxID=43041 RepID=A0A182KI85_9DIPT
MVCFIVKAPLTDGQRCTGILHLLHHLQELLVLVLAQLTVIVRGRHIQLMLGLRLRRFERAGQNRQLYVLQHGRHLRVAHRFVHYHTLH